MPEQVFKTQPDRCLALRGFDDRGAGASLHHTSATGFKVSGVFRDAADFCVLVLHDADNGYEHPILRHLPDFDFAGLTLQFDISWTGIQPLDSDRNPWIAWPYLSVIRADSTTATIRLIPDHATQVGGAYTKASNTVTVAASPAVAFDRVTLWYKNFAFDYIAAGGENAATVAANLVAQINGSSELTASNVGGVITVTAAKAGADGNMIRLYTQSKTATLTLTPGPIQLAGGSSAATWRVTLDFTALGIDSVRQMWLTFAPQLADSAAYSDTEFEVTVTNLSMTGGANKWLKVAGAGSVRVEETDSWCVYSGSSWASEAGFFSKGFAKRANTSGDGVSIKYHCQQAHDLYIGTSLYTDRGRWSVSLDGDANTTLECYLNTSAPIVTRRKVRSAVPAGEHTLTLTNTGTKDAASSNFYTYFDFLEAAVASDYPDALPVRSNVSPAMDYGTDHTYKRSPQRILWANSKMGFGAHLNVYVSVFWWNQRVRSGAVFKSATVDFTAAGIVASGNGVFVNIGGGVFGKSVFPADTAASVAKHFRYFINEQATGVWASDNGAGVLTVTQRAVNSPAYDFTISAWYENPGVHAITVGGSLSGGTYGQWDIDPAAAIPINRGSREWLADFFTEAAAAGREVWASYSLELLNPPAAWAATFPDGTKVTTATGFGTNFTTHCALGNSGLLAYQKAVYKYTAGLMNTAGLTPRLQFGEFLWWFFADHGGMAYRDAETLAAAAIALGRPLYTFLTPDDDPASHLPDADFLASRLVAHCAAIRSHVTATYAAAKFEILLPYDVNYPSVVGRYSLGGRLNNHVNIPPDFMSPAAAPFDYVKMEALDFGSGTRSLTLARETMRVPFQIGTWPKASTRYLIAVFNGGCPWEEELLSVWREGVPVALFWATDHVEMFGWPLTEPDHSAQAVLL